MSNVILDTRGLDRIDRELDRDIDTLLGNLARMTERRAKEKMDEPKTGRTYSISLGGSIIEHIAAARGEAPAVLTGALKNSGKTEHQRFHRWAVVFSAAYARRQEYGGADSRGIYIPPHPYLRPAADETAKAAPDMIKQVTVLKRG